MLWPARIRPRCCNPAHLSRDWAVDLPLLTTLAGRAENRLMSRKRQTKQSREDLRTTLLAAGQEILSIDTFNYSVFGQSQLQGEHVAYYREMEADPALREIIFSVSERK